MQPGAKELERDAVSEVLEAPSSSDAGPPRAPLDRGALAEMTKLALWVGQLLMENGAESQRVEQSVRSIGMGLGGDWANVLVTHDALMVTSLGGSDFRTKIRSVRVGGVNMSVIEEVSHLCHRVEEGKLDCARLREALTQIASRPRHYSPWQTALAAGIGCSAFCRLLGGDAWALVNTLLASGLASYVRHVCAQRGLNPLLNVGLAAFIAATLAGLAHTVVHVSETPNAALGSAVLMLVPGVPTINAIEDLIKGHITVGLARTTFAALVLFAATLGLVVAIYVHGAAR